MQYTNRVSQGTLPRSAWTEGADEGMRMCPSGESALEQTSVSSQEVLTPSIMLSALQSRWGLKACTGPLHPVQPSTAGPRAHFSPYGLFLFFPPLIGSAPSTFRDAYDQPKLRVHMGNLTVNVSTVTSG